MPIYAPSMNLTLKHMEAWDDFLAGLVIQDGRHAICMLDRNGLRPARYDH